METEAQSPLHLPRMRHAPVHRCRSAAAARCQRIPATAGRIPARVPCAVPVRGPADRRRPSALQGHAGALWRLGRNGRVVTRKIVANAKRQDLSLPGGLRSFSQNRRAVGSVARAPPRPHRLYNSPALAQFIHLVLVLPLGNGFLNLGAFMRKIGIAVAFVISLIGGQAVADTVALTSFSGGSLATSGSDQLFGWFFDLSAPVDVTALGVGDDGSPLSVSHDVGIFAVSDQSLLLSATVPAGGGTLLDGFLYVPVTPTVLPAGDYVIVMTMPSGNADQQSIQNTSETTSAPVTYVDSAFDFGSSLAYPTIPGAFAVGIFGPNFTFAGGSAVPEAPTWAMMLAGFAGLGFAGYWMSRRAKLGAAS